MGKSTNAKLMFPFLSIYASVSVKHLRFREGMIVKTLGACLFVAILPVTPTFLQEFADCVLLFLSLDQAE